MYAFRSLSKMSFDFTEMLGKIAQGTLEEFRSNPAGYVRKFTDTSIGVPPLLENLAGSGLASTPKFSPVPGSVVYTDLIPNYMQHSGIYVGDNRIVELNSEGNICLVTPDQFISGGLGLRIRVSSSNGKAVGSSIVAERALAQVGKREEYHLLLNNCHKFTSGCLTGIFTNPNNLLRMLKLSANINLGATDWEAWQF